MNDTSIRTDDSRSFHLVAIAFTLCAAAATSAVAASAADVDKNALPTVEPSTVAARGRLPPGGTDVADARVRDASWPAILEFLRVALDPR